MSFDAAAAAEALRRPAVILPRRGWVWTVLRVLGVGVPPKKYEGRILSHLEWQQFAERIEKLGKQELTTVEAGQLVIEYCDTIGIPWNQLKHLPEGVLEAAIADFFVCQGQANKSQPRPRTNGNSSLEKDSDEPSK